MSLPFPLSQGGGLSVCLWDELVHNQLISQQMDFTILSTADSDVTMLSTADRDVTILSTADRDVTILSTADRVTLGPVSYTHLTLPTRRTV